MNIRKTKTAYLFAIIFIFIFLWIPYFQNITAPAAISFFGGTPEFISIYPWILFIGIIEGALITLYIQAILRSIKYQEPQKFDLNQ